VNGSLAIAKVGLAIGLLFASSLASTPDTIEDDDVQLPAIDLSLVEPVAELQQRLPDSALVRWVIDARSTGREFSAAIFHPPI
jgi:hypothetical protein